MVTKNLLKAEIDKVPEEDSVEWLARIAEAYGSMADAPIEQEDLGSFEVRQPLEEPL